jgi:hypothetical protein
MLSNQTCHKCSSRGLEKQFHKYQQNEITLHLKSLNKKKTTTCKVGKPDPCLGQAQGCGEVSWLMESNLLIIGLPTVIQI